MPKSNAERQADYRRRHLGTVLEQRDSARLNMVISLDAAVNLELLSAAYGKSQRQIVEWALAQVMHDAEQQAVQMSGSAKGLYDQTIHLV